MSLPLSQLMDQAKLSLDGSDSIIELSGGLSQRCFDLRSDNQSYVIKQFNDKDNFEVELLVYNALKDSNLSVELITSLSTENGHFLMLEKLAGKSLNTVDIKKSEKLLLATQLLARYHYQLRNLSHTKTTTIKALPLSKILFTLLRKVKLSSAKQQHIAEVIQLTLNRLHDHTPCDAAHICCHGDLNFSNIITNETHLKVIDFESASLMPAEYDIAMMLAVNEFDETAIEPTCKNYQQAQDALKLPPQCKHVLNQALVQAYYLIAILINGLWYLSKSSLTQLSSNKNALFLEKARAQFSLSPSTNEISIYVDP